MLSTWHRWKAPEVQNVLSPGCSLFLLTISKTVFFHRRVMYISRKTRPTHVFYGLGGPARIANDTRKVEQLPLRISFMISVRPPGKATVRTTDIQVFGMCFSPILGDGLATSGESLKRYMACADSPFPRAIPGRPLSPTARAPTRTTEPEILPRCPGSGPVGGGSKRTGPLKRNRGKSCNA